MDARIAALRAGPGMTVEQGQRLCGLVLYAAQAMAMQTAGKRHGAAGDPVTTADKVRFLSSPAAHPGCAGSVEVEETHMSWVFLVGGRVYKLKKPVRYAHLDFTTLKARKANCREEVRLNRRLAPDVYLGVVPLTAGPDGRLAIGGGGGGGGWVGEMGGPPGAGGAGW